MNSDFDLYKIAFISSFSEVKVKCSYGISVHFDKYWLDRHQLWNCGNEACLYSRRKYKVEGRTNKITDHYPI